MAAGEWAFVTNHAVVLVCIARDRDSRLRDIAAITGLTEHAVNRIVNQLCAGGYITRQRQGRRNTYTVHPEVPMPDPFQGHPVGELLGVLADSSR